MRISDWSSDVCSSDLTVVGILFLCGDRNREQQRQGHDHQAAHISLPLCQVGGIKQRRRRSASRQRPAGGNLRLGEGKGRQTSRLATDSALVWMNSRRGSTSSPISRSKISCAMSACSASTRSSDRCEGSSVVSHNCSAFISPSPL